MSGNCSTAEEKEAHTKGLRELLILRKKGTRKREKGGVELAYAGMPEVSIICTSA